MLTFTHLARALSFQDFVLEGDTLGIVFLEPGLRGILISEHLDVLDVANLPVGVDVDKDGHLSHLD